MNTTQVMKSISLHSINFINSVLRNEVKKEGDYWNKSVGILFSELHDIASIVADELCTYQMGSWKFTSGDNEINKNILTYHFRIYNDQNDIDLTINPLGQSYLDITLKNYDKDQLDKFYHSSARKRYFQNHSNNNLKLRSVIPKSQVSSRHFGSYILHLIKSAKPVLCSEAKRQMQHAA